MVIHVSLVETISKDMVCYLRKLLLMTDCMQITG